MAVNLSVNLNKVALLRNSRGAKNPSPVVAAETCIRNGVAGLTLHWREDNRHALASDVRELCALAVEHGVEFNLEGDARAELIDLALELRPTQVTLVPVTPGEITSDHGWELPEQSDLLRPVVERMNQAGIRSSIFMDVGADMQRAADIGVHRVELYTEPYAEAWGTEKQEQEFQRLQATCREATLAGLGVNAGHDLDLLNTPKLAREIPELLEVSIGHALLADALYLGLGESVRRYVAACQGQDVDAPRTQ